ncbi:MAG TPA: MBL fold metallo-hydrolase [Candidatus Polarisedimenticolia bacterium]|nr:MBL fold metallo-hydrolase [Candidatus Polarisedimenticolia bacterium]
MILKQYYLGCLAHASYLVGDEQGGVAAVVDPQRDVDQYVDDARGMGVSIRYVVLTHFHADFVAGHIELRDRVGAQICLGGRAQADYPFTPLREHDHLDLGGVRLEILETPGHTPEAISLLVFDRAVDEKTPRAVLTGDTLFIGDVGRPDLMASAGFTSEELAGMLYDSLRDKLMKLPDETLVYPAHGAGSMCGKNLSKDTVSTIGEQRRFNYALQPMDKPEFIRLVTADQPEAPKYFSHDADLNRRSRSTLEESLGKALTPLTLEETLARANRGAQVLDVRDPADFAGAHMAGSINIGLGGKFATWAGTLLDKDRPIVLIAEPGREHEAATRLGRIGLDDIVGFLDGGMLALAVRPDLVLRTERITAGTLAAQMAATAPPIVLDVRAAGEWRDKRIEGSLNIPLDHLEARLAEVPRDRTVAVHCATGYRSSIAASLLARHGVTDLVDLVGGLAAWEAARLPVAASAR